MEVTSVFGLKLNGRFSISFISYGRNAFLVFDDISSKEGLYKKIINSELIFLIPVLCYLYFLFGNIELKHLLFFLNSSPEKLAAFISEPWGASLYWTYAGAFDLFVGRWIFFNSQKYDINHLLIVPALVVSIFFGPVGFMYYYIIRALKLKKIN